LVVKVIYSMNQPKIYITKKMKKKIGIGKLKKSFKNVSDKNVNII
jgi:hypothetical protein